MKMEEKQKEKRINLLPKQELSARCPVPDLRAIADIKERCRATKAWIECRKRVRKEIEERDEFNSGKEDYEDYLSLNLFISEQYKKGE